MWSVYATHRALQPCLNLEPIDTETNFSTHVNEKCFWDRTDTDKKMWIITLKDRKYNPGHGKSSSGHSHWIPKSLNPFILTHITTTRMHEHEQRLLENKPNPHKLYMTVKMKKNDCSFIQIFGSLFGSRGAVGQITWDAWLIKLHCVSTHYIQ